VRGGRVGAFTATTGALDALGAGNVDMDDWNVSTLDDGAGAGPGARTALPHESASAAMTTTIERTGPS